MTRRPLPVIDPARTEFDFCRTACGCEECRQGCYRMPGYLIPADLERIRQHVSPGESLARVGIYVHCRWIPAFAGMTSWGRRRRLVMPR